MDENKGKKTLKMSIEHTGMALTLMSAPLFRSCCTMSFLLTGLFLSIATCNGNRPIWKHIYKVFSKIIWIKKKFKVEQCVCVCVPTNIFSTLIHAI